VHRFVVISGKRYGVSCANPGVAECGYDVAIRGATRASKRGNQHNGTERPTFLDQLHSIAEREFLIDDD